MLNLVLTKYQQLLKQVVYRPTLVAMSVNVPHTLALLKGRNFVSYSCSHTWYGVWFIVSTQCGKGEISCSQQSPLFEQLTLIKMNVVNKVSQIKEQLLFSMIT